ncbi:Thiamine pyrophosphate enzyme TPP binding domain protein [Pseudorhizobium banfieldiae]|uniref:Thiamine pyrophosphate enzyme TPP binding domain protein n=2 Tax=Pseudorhizobium banfieldiae TaxID=1125847 RepID=L0NDE7_9HYPH|nr:acetolactate synthase [arsenite-oxidising bacterium NT-25]CCF18332.1 Thiamine pyrophosphate enzyme TPP binding domain protein [Pseudorhizobium banfieldiae]
MDDVRVGIPRIADPMDKIERPVASAASDQVFGSDVIAQTVQALDLPYFAMVPGSSFRGLHDSLVNHLGNENPRIVLCLHEEHAVAIADGYARATDLPIAVGLHANVGLMHAAMPIYNAWCDRVPMVIIGATGPVDAHRRRPWIDWVHTSRDQGALVRNYVKWDDQPASTEAGVESILRAHQITTTLPYGPTYVCLDVTSQEEELAGPIAVPDVRRYAAAPAPVAPQETIDRVASLLRRSQRPVFLFGRMSRSTEDWECRVALAERSGAAVLTSIHNPAAFSTDHCQHLLPVCGEQRSEAERILLAQADLIVSFDWMDLAGYLRSCTDFAQTQKPVAQTVVHASLDTFLANGWSMDHQALAAVDVPALAGPDAFAAQLLETFGAEPHQTAWDFGGAHWTTYLPGAPLGDRADCMALGDFALAVRALSDEQAVTYVKLPLGWPRAASRFNDPLAYLGKDGGGAVGIGPGTAVGAALALRNSGRLVTAVLGDGDTLMGINALWTAAHMRLPLLVIVANNTSYFNDELHQERVALRRGRPVENRWIGQRLNQPEVDIVAMARAQGFQAEGPVRKLADLRAALSRGAAAVAAGGCYLIDARVEAGYAGDFGIKPSG